MKLDLTIKEVTPFLVNKLVFENHYSKVMPKLTKHRLAAYYDNEAVGIMTLGWGTRPLHTISKLFPELTTKDYYEIGKMCMLEKMPKNSESQFLSAVIKWMKENLPERLFLFTWADGIVGKPGYVYQAANFLYGGYIWTDIYLGPDGEKIHPRTFQAFNRTEGTKHGSRPDFNLRKKLGISRLKGKQFKYIIPLSKKAKRMMKHSTVNWGLDYPKGKDLEWKIKYPGENDYQHLTELPEIMNLSSVQYNAKNTGKTETSLEGFM